ncbi:hypothetical protein [Lacticaseibacillus mingshuiensis]|uniref:Uncharacterized protein n=1 Tax=Lacticaseibacillus mingshuiensis TaxID=2799574 RepID=A0ABW4CGM9_9LACO|nr:hypothetical protein [Lacticaseibacillus mingshuiensis]
MLRDQQDVYTAKLDQISYPNITGHMENGQAILIETNKKQRDDPAFWQAISAILKAQLWVPVSKRLHQLLDTDWLAAPQLG